MIPSGRRFYKMSGSGNDFVFVDAREEPPGPLALAETIQAVCARGTGVGADGIVFLLPPNDAAVRMRYLNSDGSLAALCGNATLCAARLAAELGAVTRDGEFSIETDSGVVTARFAGSLPEIDLLPAEQVNECFDVRPGPGELRIGFAVVGVPHLVVLCADVDRAVVLERGRSLRRSPALRQGANVNFVSGSRGSWRVRTYERGVEAETLACGTGAVAAAVLLTAWSEADGDVTLETRSGLALRVRLKAHGGLVVPSLSGEARLVYVGELAEVSQTLGGRT